MRYRLVVLLLVVALPVGAEEPWSVDARHPVLPTRAEALARTPARKPSAPARVLDACLRFYQRHVSPLDGPRCALYPTCSAYARDAIRRHGIVLGAFLTADRLMQEAEVHQRAPRIRVHGAWRGSDPVEAGDFWWARRR